MGKQKGHFLATSTIGFNVKLTSTFKKQFLFSAFMSDTNLHGTLTVCLTLEATLDYLLLQHN